MNSEQKIINDQTKKSKLVDKILSKKSLIIISFILVVFLLGFYLFSITLQVNLKGKELNAVSVKQVKNKIHFINTGSSDAILIESNGQYCLVDSANPYNDGTKQAISYENDTVSHVVKYLKKVGVKSLNCIIATHSHSDHIGGMVEIARNFVNNKTSYYYRDYETTIDDKNNSEWDNEGYYNRAVNAMKLKSARLVEVTNKKNTKINVGNFAIQLLNTSEAKDAEKTKGENINSIVELIKYKNYSILLAADMETEDEKTIKNEISGIPALRQIDILKIGHHALTSATSKQFIDSIKPKKIVVTNSSLTEPNNKKLYMLSYSKRKYNSKIYLTGKTVDSIVFDFNEKNYSIFDDNTTNPTKSEVSLVSEYKGKWEKVTIDNKFVNWYYHMGEANPVMSNFKQIMSNNKYNWYYFNRYGVMVTGWQELTWKNKKNWYYFDSSGKMVTGFQKLKWENQTNWYYFNSSGAMVTGWQKLKQNNKTNWYYFDNSGKMVTGLQKLKWNNKTNWYYFNSSGAMVTGWQKIKQGNQTNWYYFDSSGKMQADKCLTIKNEKFCFKSSGICYSGRGCN